MHCLLVESFGSMAPKPFRLIGSRSKGNPNAVLYGYSRCSARELREESKIYTDPLQARILLTSKIDTKPMPSEWQLGKRLGFEVLIRPVLRRVKESEERIREQDVFQATAEKSPKGDWQRRREDVYGEWLAQEFQRRRGAKLEETRLQSFQRVRVIRGLHSRAIEGPNAIMRGTLTITDPADFATLLARGLGRHRAYGYGMLLLRPA